MKVSRALNWWGKQVEAHPKFWIGLGNFESKLLPELSNIEIRSPIYICGLARSGSTILLEMLASLPGAATHRYQDFPFIFTPYWWNVLLKFTPRNRTKRERAHGDRIFINSQSPEAMEEMLWNVFADQPDFERFYRDHIRKLLLVHRAGRYVCKNNYNIARMNRLQALFPDAKFIIPIRSPAAHIASLMRQHVRFSEAEKRDSKVLAHMTLLRHFEFGLNRQPIDIGDEARLKEIESAWGRGEEVRGWALYWDMIYRFIHTQLPNLKSQALVVPFEPMCAFPREAILRILEHIGVDPDHAWVERWSRAIRAPDYYEVNFLPEDLKLIQEITGQTMSSFHEFCQQAKL